MLKKILAMLSILIPRPEHEVGTLDSWRDLEFRKCNAHQKFLGRF